MQDEQDIEMLGSHLTKKGDTGTPPGIEMSNWDVSGYRLSGSARANLEALPSRRTRVSRRKTIRSYRSLWIRLRVSTTTRI